MMSSPNTFYEMRLKGKSPEEIMTVIRNLKREIGRLKNILEHPNYDSRETAMHPSEEIQVFYSQLYLERAKQAFAEAGGEYVPSAAERKAMEFDANIPYINKIELTIGGYFGGYTTKIYTIEDDKVYEASEYSLCIDVPEPKDSFESWDKAEFLDLFKSLRIGGWRKYYTLKRFGLMILDGTQWDLKIHYSNGCKPVKFFGNNAYPYNFDNLLRLFSLDDYLSVEVDEGEEEKGE